MIPKLIGAMLIIAACGGVGFSQAAAHKEKEKMLQQLILSAQFISCELQYRHTPLPQLMRLCGKQTRGQLRRIFLELATELDRQIAPDAACCMDAVLNTAGDLPSVVTEKLRLLGSGLGRFDLTGQLSGLETVAQLCGRDLEGLRMNRDARLRSYATLGLCAGAALVILFV